QEDERAEQEATLALQARLAQQTFEGAIGHRVLPRHLLTPRAKMRRTPRQPDTLDHRPAAGAGFAGAPVDAELALVVALRPFAADVIADARATPLDGAPQHRGDGAAQPVGGG